MNAPSPARSPREIALTYLEHCPRTCEEVCRRLRSAHAPAEDIDEIVAGFQRAGLLDDDQYARQWVETRSSRKGYGSDRLRSELLRKGVDRAAVDFALALIQPESEVEAAVAAAVKRLAGADPTDSAVKRRLTGFLQRRGHNWETIAKVMEHLTANDG